MLIVIVDKHLIPLNWRIDVMCLSKFILLSYTNIKFPLTMNGQYCVIGFEQIDSMTIFYLMMIYDDCRPAGHERLDSELMILSFFIDTSP